MNEHDRKLARALARLRRFEAQLLERFAPVPVEEIPDDVLADYLTLADAVQGFGIERERAKQQAPIPLRLIAPDNEYDEYGNPDEPDDEDLVDDLGFGPGDL